MSQTRGGGDPVERRMSDPATGQSGWVGWVVFGAIMMIMAGTFQLLVGMVALVADDVYAGRGSDLLFSVDYDVWGWLHLGLGVVSVTAAVGIFAGRLWARLVGIVLALASSLVNMAFVPAQPFWSTIMITLDVLIIYALAVHGREIKNL